MTFNAALAALLDLDDLDTEFPTPTPSAIARAAELVSSAMACNLVKEFDEVRAADARRPALNPQ